MTDASATIQAIQKLISQLEQQGNSQDVNGITILLSDLSIQAMYFGEIVSEAYAQMNQTEEDYKSAVAKSVAEYPGSAAKGERLAEVQHGKLKQEHITYKNLYQKFKSKLDRIDVILDHYKQRVSFLKMEVKN